MRHNSLLLLLATFIGIVCTTKQADAKSFSCIHLLKKTNSPKVSLLSSTDSNTSPGSIHKNFLPEGFSVDAEKQRIYFGENFLHFSRNEWFFFNSIYLSGKPIRAAQIEKKTHLNPRDFIKLVSRINKKSEESFKKSIIEVFKPSQKEAYNYLFWISETKETATTLESENIRSQTIPIVEEEWSLTIGPVELNPTLRAARHHGRYIVLTTNEWSIIDAILSSPNGVLTRQEIQEAQAKKTVGRQTMRIIDTVNHKFNTLTRTDILLSSNFREQNVFFWIAGTKETATTLESENIRSQTIPIAEEEWSLTIGPVELNPTLRAARHHGRYIVFRNDEWDIIESILHSPSQKISSIELSINRSPTIALHTVQRILKRINRKFKAIYGADIINSTAGKIYYISLGFNSGFINHNNLRLNLQTLQVYALNPRTQRYENLGGSNTSFYVLKYLIESKVNFPRLTDIYEHLNAQGVLVDGIKYLSFKSTVERQLGDVIRSYRKLYGRDKPLIFSPYGDNRIRLNDKH